MTELHPSLRLFLSVLVILGSAFYAVLVAEDTDLATSLAWSYITVVLSIFVLSTVWKRP